MTGETPRSIYETLVTQRLPAGWTARPLSDAAQIMVGSTPSREVAAFWEGEIPWITPTEITQAQGRLIVGTREGITDEGLASCTASLLPVGSVLVTTRATIGACAVAGVPMATNQGVAGLVCKDSVCEWFLHYGVATAASLLGRIAAGTTFDEISRSDLGRVLLPFPPLPEQRAIAEALQSADEVIERSRAVIEQLAQVKKALMQELLTRGLPGRHTRFKPTPVGEIPEEWEVVRLGAVAEVGNGSTPSRDEPRYWEGGSIPWLPTAKVNNHVIECADEFITDAALSECPVSLVPRGSTLIAMIGQGQTRGRVARLAIDACINQNFAFVTPKAALDSAYLFHLLDARYAELRQSGQGTNQDALNCGIVKAFRVPLPKPDEQRRIAETADAVGARARAQAAALAAAEQLKSGLMRDLLTGRRRWKAASTAPAAGGAGPESCARPERRP